MAYAITQTCCQDATCVAVCPVNCIHPTPEERAFGSTEMLHIDPRACIDCGACADACPVDAILPVPALPSSQREYAALNAAYYEPSSTAPAPAPAPNAATPTTTEATAETTEPAPEPAPAPGAAPGAAQPAPAGPSPNFHHWGAPRFDRVLPSDFGPLRVAVVGTGPAGMYAAEDLLLHTNAEVTLIDRLPVAGGLVRHGVAPDHPSTKKIGESFARFHDHPRTRMRLGVEIGEDLSVEEVAAHHDAVVYAVGASDARSIGIPGEQLAGSVAATSLVSWYNAHPDADPDAGAAVLAAERVVVVGNGNVALDVARLLVADPDALAATDIAGPALEALRNGRVREVVLLGRRGPEHAAYTASELLALRHLPNVDLVVDDHDARIGATIDGAAPSERAAVLAEVARERVDWSRAPGEGRRRIVLRFHSAPVAALGEDAVRAVRTTGPGAEVDVPARALVRAVGYRGTPPAGLPFDEDSGTVPHEAGRVADRPGTYVVGWIKRGPSGGIGANRVCAAETIGTLLADAVAGRLPEPRGSARAFARLVRRRARRTVNARGLAAIHRVELAAGAREGRSRVKLTTAEALFAASRRGRLPLGR